MGTLSVTEERGCGMTMDEQTLARRKEATAAFMLRAITAAEKAGGPKATDEFKAKLQAQRDGA
jgi:hypothetical protein